MYKILIFFFLISSIVFGCEDSLEYVISNEKMVEQISDIFIGKYKNPEEIKRLKPYKIEEKDQKWIVDTNPIWKDSKTGKMFKQGGVHIELDKKSGKIICFKLGK